LSAPARFAGLNELAKLGAASTAGWSPAAVSAARLFRELKRLVEFFRCFFSNRYRRH
jgi:hypothetical protein